jgi:hypothetical protein
MRMPVAAPLALVLLPGCGGDQLSRDELIARGDAVCDRVNRAIAREPEPRTTRELERLARRTVTLSDPAIADLEELEPPDELAGSYEEFIASLKRQRNLAAEVGKAARDGDVGQVQELTASAGRLQEEYRRLTRRIGFKECGGG